jgi:hypothetical protein
MTSYTSRLTVQGALPVVLVISHAAFVLGTLLARRQFGWEGLGGTLWIASAWLWFLWPLLLFSRVVNGKALFAALLVGAALLLPTAPTLFTLTTWSVGGFAP